MGDLKDLHIVIVPAWWPSPEQPTAGVFFQDYARAFADAGARVGVIYPDLVSLRYLPFRTRAPIVPRIESESVRDDIPVIRIRGLHTAFRQPARQMNRFHRWLRRGLEAYRSLHGMPDVLHAMCSIPSGWACSALKGELKRPFLITEVFGPFASQMTPRTGEQFVREAMAAADAVVVPSALARDDVRATGITREILVFGNCVDARFMDVEPPALRPKRDRVRALYVGRLTIEKGIRDLLDAALLMPDEAARHVEWHLVGEGPLAPEIKSRFQEAGRGELLRLHGPLPRDGVVEQMRAADLFVFPSHSDTFGLVVAEALSVGLPIVVADGTGSTEFVQEHNGVLVENGNPESLCDGVMRVVRAIDDYSPLEIARDARQRYGQGRLAEWYGEQFRRIIATQSGAQPG